MTKLLKTFLLEDDKKRNKRRECIVDGINKVRMHINKLGVWVSFKILILF